MEETTSVDVNVQSVYLASQSIPEEAHYVFAYTINIRNLGKKSIQLHSRSWLITNGNGRVTKVQGEGVVGKKPYIQPNSEFQYTSALIIDTPIGTMQGYYNMSDNKGVIFKVDIPIFRLAIQSHLH
ncbi:MAG: Co2+/Mg2+ efflux protein ApaG [Candidatus Dasytiphilus stammeri]